MDLYFVQPDLKIANCKNAPSHSLLLSKKSDYLHSKNKCDHLLHLLTSNGGLKREFQSSLNSYSCQQSSSSSSTPRSTPLPEYGTSEKIPTWCESCPLKSNHLPALESIKVDSQDYVKLTPIPTGKEALLQKLNIPKNVSPKTDGKWLALKYLQIISDISLLRYKSLKSYSKLNSILQKYFSKPEISEVDECEGLSKINDETTKYKQLQHILDLLLAIKSAFESEFQFGSDGSFSSTEQQTDVSH